MRKHYRLICTIGMFVALQFLFKGSSSLQAQWISNGVPGGGSVIVTALASSGSNIFAGTFGRGVYLSTNNGSTWITMNFGLTNLYVYSLSFSGSNFFAGTANGVFLSTNHGLSWTPANNGLMNRTIYSFAFSGTNMFVGTYENGVHISSNNGSNWNPANNGLPGNQTVTSIAVTGSSIFAGTGTSGIYLSTNSTASWVPVNTGLPFDAQISALAVSGTNIFAGVEGEGIFLSTNNGSLWTPVLLGLTTTHVYCLIQYGKEILAGTNAGVFLSSNTNIGIIWTALNEGLPASPHTGALALTTTNLFAGTTFIGIWRRPISEIISVQNISTEIPDHFRLEQNYPNPFNPITNIEFSIPKQGNVKITVYDAQGKEVASLLDQRLSAGTYKVDFDGTGYSSGVYFYRLETKNFVLTKSMILLK